MFGQMYFSSPTPTPHGSYYKKRDFPKLRELEQLRRQKLLSQQQQQLTTTTSSTLIKLSKDHNNNGSQIRFFWGNNNNNAVPGATSPTFWTTRKLKRLENDADDNPQDPLAQYAFLNELKNYHPDVVIQRCTGPSFRHCAVDGACAKLLLQMVQYTNDYRSLDTLELIQRMERTLNTSVVAEADDTVQEQKELLRQLKDYFKNTKLTKQQQVQEFMHLLSTGTVSHAVLEVQQRVYAGTPQGAAATAKLAASGGSATPLAAAAAANTFAAPGVGGMIGGGGGLFQRGADARYPLHVQMHQPGTSARTAVIATIGKAFVLLVTLSFLGAMFDDKGLGKAMGMNTSKHIQEADQNVTVRFDDVKGVEEAKQELEEIVQYLKDPSKFTRLGGKLPRGLLLTGPPGTGKTLLAKAIAGEANVPFFFSSGSQFEEVYVGLGAKRVRELFEAAKKKAPAIIFIDEIDAVGGTRKLKDQSALKMTLNELLVQLDGFDENNGIIVIGATNFMESLDDALLRPGRFDKHVTVPLPDVGGRKEILEMYAKKTKLSKDVDLSVVARGTTGMSGADLYNLMNQAALKASVDGLNAISMSVLEYAKDKILMGAERKTAVITPETAKCTAYHEAGHAIVAILTEGASPVHKATIMPRGQALGMVQLLPDGDQTSQSLKQMFAFIDVCYGGRVAEELIFGKQEITSGAMSDIKSATSIARNMVTKYGFSDEVGVVHYGGHSGEQSASDETRSKIDTEVRKVTTESYARVMDLLKKYSKEHHMLAETLLEYETLTGDEVRELVLNHKKPSRPVINKNNGARGDMNLVGSGKKSNSNDSKKTTGKGSSGGGGGLGIPGVGQNLPEQ